MSGGSKCLIEQVII